MKMTLALLLACALGGCASVPLATGLAVGSLGIAGAALAVNAYHDCKADGGCKEVPLPK
jgi:hypothetical protein